MRKNYPGICIAGRYCPTLRPLEDMDHEEILARIEAVRPDILLVAFGNPKQEKWLAMHRTRLNVPVCVGVGGSFDFLSGRVSRAPAWVQRSGMEWLYRTMQEPARLARRYAGNAIGLVRYLPLQLIATAAQTRRRSPGHLRREVFGGVTVLHVDGELTGAQVSQFEAAVRGAVLSRSHVVLEMSNAPYIGADALGALIRLMTIARSWKRELWLTGLDRSLQWVVRAAQLGSYFRLAPKVADALRRIEPEMAPVLQYGDEWSFFRIGGQLIPIHALEVPEVYRQVQQLLKQRPMDEAISAQSTAA